MASLQIFGQGRIPPPTRTGALRSCGSNTTMSGDMEATPPTEDPYFWLATCTSPSDDESHAPPFCSGSYHELPLVRWRDRGLLPPVFHVPDGTRSMADLGGCSSHRIFRRRILELLHRQFLQTGDGVEASFRHLMGDLDPQETPSGDAIQHTAGGFFYSWTRGGFGPSHILPL